MYEDISRNHADDEIVEYQPSDTKIEDLHYDCLEHILDELDFVDLIKFTSLCKYFRTIGNKKFLQSFGQKTICIQYTKYGARKLYSISKDKINVYDSDLCVLACKNIGKSITNICIDYKPSKQSGKWTGIIRALSGECFKHLERIQLIACPIFLMDEICQPMQMVTTVDIRFCNLSARILDVSKCFPSVIQLRLVQNKIFNPDALQKHFPVLIHLAFESGRCVSFFSMEHLKSMLRLNPQIEVFEIDIVPDLKYLYAICRHLPNIKTLLISTIENTFSTYYSDNIHFEHVKHCVLPINLATIEPDSTREIIPITFTHVEKLKLILNCNQLTDTITDFIIGNLSIVELELEAVCYGFDIKENMLVHIIKRLPALKHFIIDKRFINSPEMILRVLKSSSLNIFRIRSPDGSSMEVGEINGWKKIEMTDGGIAFERSTISNPDI